MRNDLSCALDGSTAYAQIKLTCLDTQGVEIAGAHSVRAAKKAHRDLSRLLERGDIPPAVAQAAGRVKQCLYMRANNRPSDSLTRHLAEVTDELEAAYGRMVRRGDDDGQPDYPEAYYDVRFDNEPENTYQRFIDAEGQLHPDGYVREFNKKIGMGA